MANVLSEVCHNVSIESHLQPLTGEVPARKTMHDLMWQLAVFGGAHAPSNQSSQIAASYRRHEREKRNKYEQRIRETEHATFTPFVLSSSGGIGPCAITVLKITSC